MSEKSTLQIYLTPVEEFASERGFSRHRAIDELVNGAFSGLQIDGEWYVFHFPNEIKAEVLRTLFLSVDTVAQLENVSVPSLIDSVSEGKCSGARVNGVWLILKPKISEHFRKSPRSTEIFDALHLLGQFYDEERKQTKRVLASESDFVQVPNRTLKAWVGLIFGLFVVLVLNIKFEWKTPLQLLFREFRVEETGFSIWLFNILAIVIFWRFRVALGSRLIQLVAFLVRKV